MIYTSLTKNLKFQNTYIYFLATLVMMNHMHYTLCTIYLLLIVIINNKTCVTCRIQYAYTLQRFDICNNEKC